MLARLSRWFIITMLSCLCLLLLAPMTTVHADGGAPNRAYIAGGAQGIEIIDIAQQKIIGHMPVPGDPQMILLSLDGNYLYVTQPSLRRVAVVIASSGEIFCSVTVPGHPTLLAMDPNANILFAASNDASTVTSISPDNCHINHVFQLHEPIYGLGVAAVGTSLSPNSGNQLWVADSTSLTVFDDIKATQVQKIPVPQGPRYISIPPGSAVYVTTQQGTVMTVDLNTYKVLTLVSGGRYTAMDFDENTGEIYVPDQKNRQLVVLEPVNAGFALPQEPGRTIPLPSTPNSVAITSDGQLAFVALQDGKVAMFDIPAHQFANTFDLGGSPHFIITGLNPPVFSATPQQAHTLQNIITVVAYIIVAVLLVVPIILFRRYAKAHYNNFAEDDQEPSLEDRDHENNESDQHQENRDSANVQPEMRQREAE
jgi:DNA-binding beta-propeller fold protein YncE